MVAKYQAINTQAILLKAVKIISTVLKRWETGNRPTLKFGAGGGRKKK